ncbi:MAG TPA: hypothetical protein VF069_22815 [Streptosporangiaceae bacterium]
MPRSSWLSPLALPWHTGRLAMRFAIPLVLWFTVGRAVRYGVFYAGYRFMGTSWVPIVALSLGVLAQLAVTVVMLHSVRDGLAAIRRGARDENMAPWAAGEEESIFDALGRALLPFLIFYVAWGWFGKDARELVASAEGRGFAEGGIFEQIKRAGLLVNLVDHMYIAMAATAIFFIAKTCTDWWLVPRLARVGPLLLAVFELHWTLFGVFTVDHYRGNVGGWVTGRQAWGWLGDVLGPAASLWGPFKNAVLGALIWLVIAGVILGVDADERAAIGRGRIGRRLAAVSGIHRPKSPREVLSRELRDKWFPAVHGIRLVRRAGWMPFGVFCVLFVGLDVMADYLRRGAYYLVGPHPIPFWMVRLTPIDLGVDLVHDVLRICLLAAAFDLLVARVSARNEARRARSAPGGHTRPRARPAPLSPPSPPAPSPSP